MRKILVEDDPETPSATDPTKDEDRRTDTSLEVHKPRIQISPKLPRNPRQRGQVKRRIATRYGGREKSNRGLVSWERVRGNEMAATIH